VPTNVRRHDAAVRKRDRSLETWIADRHYALCQACRHVRDSVYTPSRYDQEKRQVDHEVATLRAAALHEFRDEARLARNDAARILVSEDWKHDAWRRFRKRPPPGMTAEGRATPLLNAWRSATREATDQAPTEIEDATQRTLDAMLQRQREHPTDP
jgi:hypothetical protein